MKRIAFLSLLALLLAGGCSVDPQSRESEPFITQCNEGSDDAAAVNENRKGTQLQFQPYYNPLDQGQAGDEWLALGEVPLGLAGGIALVMRVYEAEPPTELLERRLAGVISWQGISYVIWDLADHILEHVDGLFTAITPYGYLLPGPGDGAYNEGQLEQVYFCL